ncbi:hypothetical protein [Flavilitoribacter nigricans]|uniref:OmpA-like domain-containing protein n=1 Tax=Flavilitoribacter nigricans (strain ATCC 23147 / DSM 23189 / NBRC 102662 / NCIMB 1420 / SS-2) TaxID=1122177 RepID=A0A2D0N285_FLAN2|nr:hypothetical protein [Flavilitoribacter nigricans]PHN02239.1 hypothetical protein CRP01_33435 [Flavilitoribacter nigricans DSM 23189 = NBRC 102662]
MRKKRNRQPSFLSTAILQILLAAMVPGGVIIAIISLINTSPPPPCASWSKQYPKIAAEAQKVDYYNGATPLSPLNYNSESVKVELAEGKEPEDWPAYFKFEMESRIPNLINKLRLDLPATVDRELLKSTLTGRASAQPLINGKNGLSRLFIPDFDLEFDRENCKLIIHYRMYAPKSHIICSDALQVALQPGLSSCSDISKFISNPINQQYSPVLTKSCLGRQHCDDFQDLSPEDVNFLRITKRYNYWAGRCADNNTYFDPGAYAITELNRADLELFSEVIANYVRLHPQDRYLITCMGFADPAKVSSIAYHGLGRYHDQNKPLRLDHKEGAQIPKAIPDNYLLSWARSHEGATACNSILNELLPPELRDRITIQYQGMGVKPIGSTNDGGAQQRRVEFLFTNINS